MNYLLYIERAPENLQFYLWLRSYVQRFEEAKTPDIALAPKWTDAMQEEAISKTKPSRGHSASTTTNVAAAMFKGTDFEAGNKPIVAEPSNPFSDPSLFSEKHDPKLKKERRQSTFNSNDESMFARSATAESYQTTASEAFSVAGLKQPCKLQNFVYLLTT